MIVKYFTTLTLILLIVSEAHTQTRSVSITIDDLPGTHGGVRHYLEVNQKLLETLKKHQIPAIGFVNEGKLYTNGEADTALVHILKDWLEAGMELGNHTYSHVFINQTSLEDYKKEVLKGEIITRPLMEEYGMKLRYFRHTQLRTGPTEEYRLALNKFLENHGYTVAPVTIDNDEYIYAYCYYRAHLDGDEKLKAWVRSNYLDYMEEIFSYYENLSVDFLNDEPPQVLLLHVNLLNADTLPELLDMMKRRNYQFVSLGQALKDDAYQLPVVQADRGLSWLHRWMLAEGKTPEPQPPVSGEIQKLFNNYRSTSE